jgi:uncharacterized coiled-coil protein SlyX
MMEKRIKELERDIEAKDKAFELLSQGYTSLQARIAELTEALQHLVDLDESYTTPTIEQEGFDKAKAVLEAKHD